MEALTKWKIETNTEYSEPSLLSMESTCCSSFLAISHCLHWSARNLNLVKNCWMVSKLLGCKAINLFSKMCPQSSSWFPNKASSFSQASWESSNLQGERGDLWICEYICNQKIHLSGSETCFSLLDDGAQPPFQVLSWRIHVCTRIATYLPSNQHNWRVLGSEV